MNRISLLNEVNLFLIKVKEDYKYNIISKDKYELILIELRNLIVTISSADLLISITKFHTIKTIYSIMK